MSWTEAEVNVEVRGMIFSQQASGNVVVRVTPERRTVVLTELEWKLVVSTLSEAKFFFETKAPKGGH
jgi:hypothetical protein